MRVFIAINGGYTIIPSTLFKEVKIMWWLLGWLLGITGIIGTVLSTGRYKSKPMMILSNIIALIGFVILGFS